MAVAKSALHPRQHFSVLPRSSNNASIRPQTLHCAIESCSVPFGPVDMIVPPMAPCRSSHISQFRSALVIWDRKEKTLRKSCAFYQETIKRKRQGRATASIPHFYFLV